MFYQSFSFKKIICIFIFYWYVCSLTLANISDNIKLSSDKTVKKAMFIVHFQNNKEFVTGCMTFDTEIKQENVSVWHWSPTWHVLVNMPFSLVHSSLKYWLKPYRIFPARRSLNVLNVNQVSWRYEVIFIKKGFKSKVKHEVEGKMKELRLKINVLWLLLAGHTNDR